MKKLLVIVFALLLYGIGLKAQDSEQVVKGFGDAMQEWCNTDDIRFRFEKLDKITGGETSCRIEDEVSRLMFEYKKGLLKSNFDASVYLDQIRDAITSSKGQKFQMTNITLQQNFVAPTAFKDEKPPTFVSADLMLKGYYNCNTTDLFYVRGKHITRMVDFMSDESLGKAISLYSKGNYDEAFRIFRKLAYADFTNFDAQYYTVVMEIKKQGCSHLDKNFRDKEIAWFIYKNYYAANEDATRLLVRFNIDASGSLPYFLQNNWQMIIKFMPPADSDRMLSYDKKKKKCGFIDEKGNLVIDYKYNVAYPFHEGMALVVNDAGKIGFINKDGDEVVPMIYKDAFWNFHKEGNFCLDASGNVVLIDKNGRVRKFIGHYQKLHHAGCPIGQYATIYKTGNIFDVYDYEGNLICSDCNSWSADSKTGIITVKRANAKVLEYKIEW